MSNLDAEMAELELELDLEDLFGFNGEEPDEVAAKLVVKTCKYCGETDQDKLSKRNRSGKIEIERVCKFCKNLRRKKWGRLNPEKQMEMNKRRGLVVKGMRKIREHDGQFILESSRRSDKVKGYENDLTREFVDSKIKDGCQYCGETKLKMTLDRILNDIGHIKSNVVPSCVSCNYIRRDMPFEAWSHIAPKMREARKMGLFGDWVCCAKSK